MHEEFDKIIKKILIDKEMNLKQLAEASNESPQNLIQKLGRKTIRLMDVENILNALDYDLIIKDRKKEEKE